VEWRWWLSGIRFGGVRLESTLRRGALHGLYWKVIGWFVLLSIASGMYFGLCAGLIASMNGATLPAQPATFKLQRATGLVRERDGVGFSQRKGAGERILPIRSSHFEPLKLTTKALDLQRYPWSNPTRRCHSLSSIPDGGEGTGRGGALKNTRGFMLVR